MSDYTPTTDEVRASHAMEYLPPSYGEAAFNRWLAAHDAEIEREAFTRGFAAGDDARSTAELDALTAAELYMKQREAEIRADEREQAAQRAEAEMRMHTGHADWLSVQDRDVLDAIAAARGDGDCQHDWQHLKGEKCPTCRRCGAARGGEQDA